MTATGTGLIHTQRRGRADGPGVTWVHGTDIGVATSPDGGLTWAYRDEAVDLDLRRAPS